MRPCRHRRFRRFNMSSFVDTEERPAKPAILDGLRRRCPNCQKAPLFAGYLKAVDSCASCGEVYSHHRADDGPAYVVILIVAHIIGLAFHFLFNLLGRDPLLIVSIFIPVSIALCLFLLPRVKGAFIGLQWAKRMHGFSVSNIDK